jgi:hypothetical protein
VLEIIVLAVESGPIRLPARLAIATTTTAAAISIAAATATAATAAIATVSATATATAATAAATTIAAKAAATTAATAAASAAIFTWASFVDVQVAAIEFLAIELLNSFLALFRSCHFDEAEAARTPGLTIFNY